MRNLYVFTFLEQSQFVILQFKWWIAALFRRLRDDKIIPVSYEIVRFIGLQCQYMFYSNINTNSESFSSQFFCPFRQALLTQYFLVSNQR